MRHRLLGIAFVVALAVTATLVAAQFNRALDRVVPITVLADRSGLLLDAGAPVKVLGVDVGSVRSVQATPAGATIHIGLFEDLAARIPGDARAKIVPPTVFGAKYLELVRPRHPARGPIRADAVIAGAEVTVEINTTFEHTLDLLRAVEPAKLDSALTAVAGALRGNGSKLGTVLTDLDGYLGRLTPSLPQLHQDLDESLPVLRTYTDITPDLLRIGGNLGATSDTLVAKRAQFAAFLVSLTEFGDHTAKFLGSVERPFVSALDVLSPTTRLFARYSAMFPCLFQGLDVNRALLEKAVDDRGINVVLAPSFGAEPYHYPDDLPVVRGGTGPDCHGLPDNPVGGPEMSRPAGPRPPLAEILFGKAVPR
ncbi:MCE family protein [Kutzneria viridogrisea]|uniref:Phospholipid/cholesterol/gamma-HCH transport system substrate-binding protein n=1 Tax=Kutzneria viridogrisea TaxID=47990 RepID=A0ABR6BHH7_9PSEU|nr:phospholipid/cholesterol/gamma-HCH transport system substrate-binding protein [Kutzneria viridogrisea]